MNPSLDALAAECYLALLALHWLKQNFEANVTDEKWLERIFNCVSWR
jgi:hypothetical protein